MYTDEDLDFAVKNDVFTEKSVEIFRRQALERSNTDVSDEENFRLVTGFNDIFVTIACALLLLSFAWVSYKIDLTFSAMIVSVL